MLHTIHSFYPRDKIWNYCYKLSHCHVIKPKPFLLLLSRSLQRKRSFVRLWTASVPNSTSWTTSTGSVHSCSALRRWGQKLYVSVCVCVCEKIHCIITAYLTTNKLLVSLLLLSPYPSAFTDNQSQNVESLCLFLYVQWVLLLFLGFGEEQQ